MSGTTCHSVSSRQPHSKKCSPGSRNHSGEGGARMQSTRACIETVKDVAGVKDSGCISFGMPRTVRIRGNELVRGRWEWVPRSPSRPHSCCHLPQATVSMFADLNHSPAPPPAPQVSAPCVRRPSALLHPLGSRSFGVSPKQPITTMPMTVAAKRRAFSTPAANIRPRSTH